MLDLSLFWTAGLSVWENMLRAPLMMILSRSIFLRMSVMVVPRSCSPVSMHGRGVNTAIVKVEGVDHALAEDGGRVAIPVGIRYTTGEAKKTRVVVFER